jgi:hypothetical protein
MDTFRLIKVERIDGVACARLLRTRLEEGEILQLGDELLALANEAGGGRVALALGPQQPDCLYSVFLAKLVSVRNACRRNRGELVLHSLSPLTYSVFEASHLHKEFVFRPGQAEAVTYLNAVNGSSDEKSS